MHLKSGLNSWSVDCPKNCLELKHYIYELKSGIQKTRSELLDFYFEIVCTVTFIKSLSDLVWFHLNAILN